MPLHKKSHIDQCTSIDQEASATTNRKKRERCQHCKKPMASCHCDLLVNINNNIKVVILQHKKEAKHALNTAQLVNQCLEHSEIILCEDNAIALPCNIKADGTYLLYPEDEALTLDSTLEKSSANALRHQPPQNPVQAPVASPVQTLVVLDATWRKANKMLMTSPDLQSLKKIQLHQIGQTRGYTLRKAKSPSMLSTLEAVAHALATLEDDDKGYASLLNVLADFMALHSRHIPPEHLVKMQQRI